MNPDLKVLRVAVVPTETGNGISQDSTVEEILACKETRLFSVPDYFQAQNDSEIDLLHWSFLINIDAGTDITGTNTDGIDYDSKAIKIGKIKKIIADWGTTSCSELELDHSPSLNSLAGGDVCELVENFGVSGVETIVYHEDVELQYNNYLYDELPEDILDEIVEIMEDYETQQQDLMDSCKDENF